MERNRWKNNDRVSTLLKEAETRTLLPSEIEEIRAGYTGYGGLYDSFGQFFTPSVVTRFIVDLLGINGGHVLEPSCGAGAFLEALPPSCEVEGFELMHEAYSVAKLLYPSAKLTKGNTLTHLQDLEGRFDYVIGNPPFCDVPKYEDYSGYTIAQQGRNRAEWFFLELGLRALKPGGIMAVILPEGVLSNKKEEILRKWIMEMAWVRASISLPPETFKLAGTTVKTSILVLQKMVPGVDLGDYSIFMAMCDHIGWDSRGRETGKCDLPAILEAWREFHPAGLPDAADLLSSAATLPVALVPLFETPLIPTPEAAADNRWGQLAFGF